MTEEQIDEHFRSLENHRNAIKVLVARIESEQAKMPPDDKARASLEKCTQAFNATLVKLDEGVDLIAEALVEKKTKK